MTKLKRNKRLIRYFNEQAGNCAYCLYQMTLELGYENTATIDHFEPTSKGGLKKRFNEIAVCSKCNNRKGNRDPIEYLRWRARHFWRNGANDNEPGIFDAA